MDMDARQRANLISENYGKLADELLKAVEATTKLSEVNQLFTDFSRRRTMIPELWLKWLELETKITFEDFNAANLKIRQNAIKALARKQFFHYKFVDSDKSPLEKDGVFEECFFLDEDTMSAVSSFSKDYPTNLEGFESYLKFPNLSLLKVKNICEKFGTRPLSSTLIKNYKESCQQREQIVSMSKNRYVQDWKQNLAKYPSKNFAINTFEHFLATYPNYHYVWKYYIKFLNSVNNNLKLHAYSRYCRLFTDHAEMRRKYFQCVERFRKESKLGYLWWIDAIEIERVFGDNSGTMMERAQESKTCQNPKFVNYSTWYQNIKGQENANFSFQLPILKCSAKSWKESTQPPKKPFKISVPELPSPLHFSPENSVQQLFSLPYDVMNYVKAKCNFAIKQKLFQSCKFFYQKSQQPLCYRLGIFENTISTYSDQSLFLNSSNFIFAGVDGAILTNSLQIPLRHHPNAASIILSKISECHILVLELKSQNLTEAEFDQLVGNQRIQDISLRFVNIKNAKKELLSVEQILAKISNASSIALVPLPEMYTPETAESISKLVRPKNIKYFYLCNIPNDFNEICFQFFVKNALHSASIFIAFEFGANDDFKKEFYKKGQEILDDKVYTFKAL